MNCRRLLGALATAWLLCGCAAGYRVGVGPTVDTRGRVGASVTLSGYFGVGRGNGLGVVPVVEASAGAQLDPVGPAVDFAVGWDVIQAQDEEIALRIGARMHARWVLLDVEGDTKTASIEAVAAGSPEPLRRCHLSVELRGGVGWADGFADSDPFGTFALSLVYDRLVLWDPLDPL